MIRSIVSFLNEHAKCHPELEKMSRVLVKRANQPDSSVFAVAFVSVRVVGKMEHVRVSWECVRNDSLNLSLKSGTCTCQWLPQSVKMFITFDHGHDFIRSIPVGEEVFIYLNSSLEFPLQKITPMMG